MHKGLIYDNSASIKGKGVTFARNRLDLHLRQHYRKYGNNGYVLRYDFKSYFNNIPHDVVIGQINKTDLDDKTKAFTIKLIKQNKGDRGLGIGAEISQVLAATYANSLDHLIKDKLRIKGYGRYNDDGYLLCHDKVTLEGHLKEIQKEVENIGGILNTKKTQIIKLSRGFEYLKTRYYLTETGKIIKKPHKPNITRQRKKLKKLKKKLKKGEIQIENIKQSQDSWMASMSQCNAHHARRNMTKLYDDLFKEVENASDKKAN